MPSAARRSRPSIQSDHSPCLQRARAGRRPRRARRAVGGRGGSSRPSRDSRSSPGTAPGSRWNWSGGPRRIAVHRVGRAVEVEVLHAHELDVALRSCAGRPAGRCRACRCRSRRARRRCPCPRARFAFDGGVGKLPGIRYTSTSTPCRCEHVPPRRPAAVVARLRATRSGSRSRTAWSALPGSSGRRRRRRDRRVGGRIAVDEVEDPVPARIHARSRSSTTRPGSAAASTCRASGSVPRRASFANVRHLASSIRRLRGSPDPCRRRRRTNTPGLSGARRGDAIGSAASARTEARRSRRIARRCTASAAGAPRAPGRSAPGAAPLCASARRVEHARAPRAARRARRRSSRPACSRRLGWPNRRITLRGNVDEARRLGGDRAVAQAARPARSTDRRSGRPTSCCVLSVNTSR